MHSGVSNVWTYGLKEEIHFLYTVPKYIITHILYTTFKTKRLIQTRFNSLSGITTHTFNKHNHKMQSFSTVH